MLYYLGGENTYQSVERLFELQNEFINEQSGVVNIFQADEVTSVNDLLKSSDSISLFDKSGISVIKYLSQAPKSYEEKIIEFLEGKKTFNFIFWEPKPLDKRRKLYKYIKRVGIVEEFSLLSHTQLKSWISRYLNKISFNPQCIELLILKVGNDQFQLSSLLDNLMLLTKIEGKARLEPQDIDRFVAKTAEESIWELVDAISINDKKTALTIVENMIQEKSDSMMIIAMIARQLRILLLTRTLLEEGQTQADIIRTLKLHPFVARKALIQSHNFSIEQLKKFYQKLVNTDLAIKEGRFEEKLALDLFIAAL